MNYPAKNHLLSRREFIKRTVATSVATAAAMKSVATEAGGASPRVGCQLNAWKIEELSFDELLGHVAELKALHFEAFECNVRFVEHQFANAREAREKIEHTGVQFFGPHTGLKWPLDPLKRYVDGAVTLGAKHFALSGSGLPVVDGQLDGAALGKKVDALNEFGAYCRQAGLRLAYHNHVPEFAAAGREIEELLRRTDPQNVSLLFDIGHAAAAQADPAAFFARHHERIDALHIRDLKAGQQVPLGQGEIDLKALAAAIRQAQWPGWLTLEEESIHSPDNDYVRSVLTSSRQVIRDVFGV